MTPRSTLVLSASLLTLVVSGLTGCKPDTAAKPGQAVPAASNTTKGAPYTGPSGSVSGVVSFSGKPPAKVAIDTTMDPACSISSPKPVMTEQYDVASGKLGNVFVYVKAGPPAAMQAGPVDIQPVVLDQKGCQYTPHVIAVMAGGTVEFRNSDLTMHNIHTMPTATGNETGNQAIDVSQGPKGAPVTKQFLKPELMMPVRCNNHPWMNAFLNVSATPFFAVSDATGHFALKGMPPGEYTLGAVHEKLGEKEIKATVTANGDTTASVSFAGN